MTKFLNSKHEEEALKYAQNCLGHWALEFEIYPSTRLRVVSLSNHL